MSASSLAPLYGSIYGSMYFAAILSTAFYGVTCMQTFFYYVHYPNDPLLTKTFVGVVWAFNTIHEALTISGAYKSLMDGLISPYSLLNGVAELILQLLLTALVAITTQGFFVYRIYLFNGKKNVILLLVWAPLAVYQLASTIIYMKKSLYDADGSVHVIEFFELEDRFFMGIATSSLAVAAAVDVSIAVFLTFLLVRKRTTAGFSSTTHTLQRLTVFAVNAGIWTATFALLSLILLHVYPSNLLYAVFAFPLCSVYCNTLLANLNARAYIRGETATPNVDVDLFASATSQGSVGIKGDQRVKMLSFRATPANTESHGMMCSPVIVDKPGSTMSEGGSA
ncbi:hypothetical protein V8E55_005317 [Tylopilus felleus]